MLVDDKSLTGLSRQMAYQQFKKKAGAYRYQGTKSVGGEDQEDGGWAQFSIILWDG